MNRREREAVQVFALGKLMYCIFEGVASVRREIYPSLPQDSNDGPEFPEFRSSPPQVRNLIIACTRDAHEYDNDRPGLIRHGGRLYPRKMSVGTCEGVIDASDVVRESELMWTATLKGIVKICGGEV